MKKGIISLDNSGEYKKFNSARKKSIEPLLYSDPIVKSLENFINISQGLDKNVEYADLINCFCKNFVIIANHLNNNEQESFVTFDIVLPSGNQRPITPLANISAQIYSKDDKKRIIYVITSAFDYDEKWAFEEHIASNTNNIVEFNLNNNGASSFPYQLDNCELCSKVHFSNVENIIVDQLCRAGESRINDMQDLYPDFNAYGSKSRIKQQ